MTRTAVLLLTHFFDDFVARQFDRLRRECPPGYDPILALNLPGGGVPVLPDAAQGIRSSVFLSNDEALLTLPYPRKCDPIGWDGKGWRIVPGNADAIVLHFYRRCPDIDHVWGIEYDAHFEGTWGALFGNFDASPADLLAATLRVPSTRMMRALEQPLLDPSGDLVPRLDAMGAFLPVFRLSKAAFRAIDHAYRAGWSGHNEVSWPTIVMRAGLELEDIGGDGPYARPENRNRFYFNCPWTISMTPGIFVWRPFFRSVMAMPNTLWHPIKPDVKGVDWSPKRNPNLLWFAYQWLRSAANWAIIWLWFQFVWRGRRPAKETPRADNPS